MFKMEIIAGLDIGSSNVRCLIGEIIPGQQVNVIGRGESTARGIRKGIIVEKDEVVKSIEEAVSEAEKMAGINISSVFVNITGEHITSFNNKGAIAISGNEKEIMESDVKKVLDAVRILSIPSDREVIHLIPRGFTVDGQNGIKNPVGLSGMRLEVDTYIATGISTMIQNLVKSVHNAGLEIEPSGIVLESIAASMAALDAEEKQIGSVLINLGGGTTDISIFKDGNIVYTGVIPYGGSNITYDLAVAFRIPLAEAERLKIEYGYATSRAIPEKEEINITGITRKNSSSITSRDLAEVIEARVTEILEMVKKEIREAYNGERYLAGVTLVGGGAKLRGIEKLTEEMLEFNVRIGYPENIKKVFDEIRCPAFNTSVGLLIYGAQMRKKNLVRFNGVKISGVWRNIFRWLQEIF